MTEPIDHELTD